MFFISGWDRTTIDLREGTRCTCYFEAFAE